MASDIPFSKTFATASVSAECSAALIAAAIEAARESGFAPSVAITDNAGNLKAFERTDAAPILTVQLAIDKAWTASAFGFPTHVWNTIVGDPKVAPLGHYPRVVAIAGGLPLIDEDGKLVGGIGVSGGSVDQDQSIAEQALTALGFALPQ